MLRILHTADWHLGQTFRGHSREFEHQAVFGSLLTIIQQHQIDTLLIAGDIFDSQHPSGEAQALFYRMLARLHAARPEMNTIVIAGNHDAAGRLEAPHPLLDSFKVHIVGNVRRIDGRVDCSRHLLALKGTAGDLYLHILALSYPTAACLPPIQSSEIEEEESNVIRSVRSLYDELYQALSPKLTNLPFVVMGHLHVRGGIESEGAERRILVGGQHAVPHDVFPADASYVALGHLHKAQSVGSNAAIRYSGSLIPLSATEQPYRHGVTLVTIDSAAVTTEHIEIPRPVPFLSLGTQAAGVRISELADHLQKLGLSADLAPHLHPFLQIRLSRQGLGSGFREQVDRIASSFPVRIVEARPDPLPEQIAQAVAHATPLRSLTHIEPEEMFLRAFRRASGADATEDHLKVFHRAYAEAQE
jgi:exonuclease SbcD